MKKITLLFFLLTISLGYSQVVLENFSSGITTSNWKGDSGLGSATTETLSPNGLAGKIITSNAAGAQTYQNAQLYMQSNRIDLSTANKVVTVDVYSTASFDMLAKVADGGSAPESAAEARHTGSGWETLSFDFSAPKDGTPTATGEYARILFFPLWKLGGGFKAVAVTTTYVDNIKGKAGAVIVASPPPPSAGPAIPAARSTSDYISFYNGIANPVSPQYTNLVGVIFDSFGGSTIEGDVTLADGNIVKKYTNHNYSGIGGGDVNASAMTKLHLDVYSPNFTSFKIKLEAVNGSNKEIEVPFTKTQGAWNSYDLDLSTYAGVDLAHLKWIVPVTNGGTTMYVDNVYFYKAAAADPAKIATLSDLKVDGVTVTGFAAGKLNYSFVLPKGTTIIPQITAVTKTNSLASEVIIQASALPGGAAVDVTSQDGTTTAKYTVSFTLDASTACEGTSKEVPANGTLFSEGYTYKFETLANGTDVKITFTVLDTDKPGISNVELFRSPSTFTAMTLVSGQQYTVTIMGQVAGTEISLAGKFPYAEGGVVQTKNFKYTVGENCSTGSTDAKDAALTDLKVDAQTVAGFVPGKLIYSVVLPKGTTTIPQITSVTKANSLGSTVITQASALPGDATVVVTSQDGTVTAKYTVSFTLDTSTACAGTSKEAFEGSYSAGYKYNFVTSGADVIITFELLDTDKTGFSPQVYFQAPDQFIPMTNPSGQIYKATLAGKTAGEVLKFAIRGAYAGGLVTSKFFEYKVGDSCESQVVATAPVLPLDFESSTIAYSFIDFDGGAVTKIANPDKTGANTSATVAKMVKGAGQPWGGSKIVMASAVDFSTKKLFKVKVWSPVAGKKLLLKFEGAGAAFEKESIGVTTANAWQELSFDFTGVAVNNLNDNIVFIFDLGTAGDGSANSTYYFDDVSQSAVAVVSTAPTLPLDFESSTTAYSFIDFDGGVATKIANPDKTGANTSATVAKMVKGAGQPWGGSKIVMASAVDFSTKKLFKVKVWSPVAGKKLLLKFEGAGAAFEKESIGVTTANAWQELSFDFTGVVGVNNLNDNLIFIFDLGTAGDGSANSTYYFDDVVQSAAVVGSTSTTVTIDGSSVLTGYLNWFNKDGSYASGSGWAIADVKTVSDATNDKVTLSPNFNTYKAGDAYWSDGAGKGNKIIEGNSFIENSALVGQILTFNGFVDSNTLAAGYTAIAFIKGLDASKGYEDVLKITAPLVAGQSFSISTGTAIPAGLIVQYGFTIKGLNGNPADEAALGKVVIGKSTLGTTKFEVSNVKMYPNPVKNNLTIEANSTIERVSVYNILGQEVLSARPNANAATLQTNNLQKGIYIVKTEIDGKVSASKIIKE